MHAETIETANWWAKSRGQDKDSWIRQYQNSLTIRHRDVIAGIVKQINPGDLLEIGCHCGPNLIRLAREMPALKAIGVDINAEAIEAGKRWIQSEGYTDRLELHVGRIPDALERLPSMSCDVVLSCYTLAYIAPSDLDAVLYEIGRLATKAVIFAEPMGGKANRSTTGYSVWGHQYSERAKWIGTLRGMTWGVSRVTPPVDALDAVLVGVRSENTP